MPHRVPPARRGSRPATTRWRGSSSTLPFPLSTLPFLLPEGTGFPEGGLTARADFAYSVGQMKKADSLGQFEQLVLTAVLALEDDAYGVTIHAKIEELA